ncbi:tRNA lysidine(34) synthetase TilS, partial [Calditrichota bacterium]
MIDKVRNFIVSNNLIPSGNNKLYAAVSGGIDSCVLLHILYSLREEFGYELKIAHFNHKTRGTENLKDAEFVSGLAKNYNLPIKIGQYSGVLVKKSEGFLREQRYKFFNSVLKENRNTLIATAHNSDDNVETFLMRLARGSRLKGLIGITPRRGSFIRPLLSIDRKQIEYYAKENDILFREDSTNKDNSITRNLVRNKLIPAIEESFGNNLKKNVLKIMDDLTLHYVLYTEQLQQAIKQTIKSSKYGLTLNRNSYQDYNVPVRRGLIEYCISSVQPLNYGISNKSFVLWDEFVLTASPGKKNNIFEAGYALA